jgi:hypothetical protein
VELPGSNHTMTALLHDQDSQEQEPHAVSSVLTGACTLQLLQEGRLAFASIHAS